MITTAAAANKLVKQLQDELDFVYQQQSKAKTYTEVVGQAPIIPDYDFAATQRRIIELETKIRTIKHAINVHNTMTTLPDYNVTIDQALIMLAQYNKRISTVGQMRGIQKKVMDTTYGNNTIPQYTVANFNPEDAANEYSELYTKIQMIQMALDTANATKTFTIEGL